MNKFLKFGFILILIIFLFRGTIYRLLINYSQIGKRSTILVTESKLIAEIENKDKDEKIDLNRIINIANSITTARLSFTSSQSSNDPNELIKSGKANCIGYSAMFNSIATFLINKHKLNKEYKAEHLIGKLDLFGMDLHESLDNPFFKDHDFNRIENLQTGEIIYIDPSINDYLGIKAVASKVNI